MKITEIYLLVTYQVKNIIMVLQETPNGTKRLFLYRDELPKNPTILSTLLVALGTFSIWGNYDQNKEEYISWEFDSSISEDVIRKALLRLDCNLIKNQ